MTVTSIGLNEVEDSPAIATTRMTSISTTTKRVEEEREDNDDDDGSKKPAASSLFSSASAVLVSSDDDDDDSTTMTTAGTSSTTTTTTRTATRSKEEDATTMTKTTSLSLRSTLSSSSSSSSSSSCSLEHHQLLKNHPHHHHPHPQVKNSSSNNSIIDWLPEDIIHRGIMEWLNPREICFLSMCNQRLKRLVPTPLVFRIVNDSNGSYLNTTFFVSSSAIRLPGITGITSVATTTASAAGTTGKDGVGRSESSSVSLKLGSHHHHHHLQKQSSSSSMLVSTDSLFYYTPYYFWSYDYTKNHRVYLERHARITEYKVLRTTPQGENGGGGDPRIGGGGIYKYGYTIGLAPRDVPISSPSPQYHHNNNNSNYNHDRSVVQQFEMEDTPATTTTSKNVRQLSSLQYWMIVPSSTHQSSCSNKQQKQPYDKKMTWGDSIQLIVYGSNHRQEQPDSFIGGYLSATTILSQQPPLQRRQRYPQSQSQQSRDKNVLWHVTKKSSLQQQSVESSLSEEQEQQQQEEETSSFNEVVGKDETFELIRVLELERNHHCPTYNYQQQHLLQQRQQQQEDDDKDKDKDDHNNDDDDDDDDKDGKETARTMRSSGHHRQDSKNENDKEHGEQEDDQEVQPPKSSSSDLVVVAAAAATSSTAATVSSSSSSSSEISRTQLVVATQPPPTTTQQKHQQQDLPSSNVPKQILLHSKTLPIHPISSICDDGFCFLYNPEQLQFASTNYEGAHAHVPFYFWTINGIMYFQALILPFCLGIPIVQDDDPIDLLTHTQDTPIQCLYNTYSARWGCIKYYMATAADVKEGRPLDLERFCHHVTDHEDHTVVQEQVIVPTTTSNTNNVTTNTALQYEDNSSLQQRQQGQPYPLPHLEAGIERPFTSRTDSTTTTTTETLGGDISSPPPPTSTTTLSTLMVYIQVCHVRHPIRRSEPNFPLDKTRIWEFVLC